VVQRDVGRGREQPGQDRTLDDPDPRSQPPQLQVRDGQDILGILARVDESTCVTVDKVPMPVEQSPEALSAPGEDLLPVDPIVGSVGHILVCPHDSVLHRRTGVLSTTARGGGVPPSQADRRRLG